jgi:hypothetical protein
MRPNAEKLLDMRSGIYHHPSGPSGFWRCFRLVATRALVLACHCLDDDTSRRLSILSGESSHELVRFQIQALAVLAQTPTDKSH